MKQLSFPLPKPRKEHGGSLAVRKRRSRRPLNIKQAHHVTLKSNLATGGRCLRRHQTLIKYILYRSAKRFHVKIYQYAVAGNHLHVLVKAKTRLGMQNFFRVFAGHTAQEILKLFPLHKPAGGAPISVGVGSSGGALHLEQEPHLGCATGADILRNPPCAKNQRKFWGFLIYSRILTWGKEYRTVYTYIIQNSLEALQLIAYQMRGQKYFNSA